MSVYAGQMKLKRASKDLLARWRETKTTWRDDVSRRFEEHHIVPLMTKLRTAEAALAHMVVILDKIHRDCE